MIKTVPDQKKFLRLAKKGNLIPVCREIPADLETPVSLFLKLGDAPYSYLLESVESGEKIARYSFIAASPSMIFSSKGKRVTIEKNGKIETFETKKGPLFELEKLLKRFKEPRMEGLPPFSGGAVGYLGYDTVRFIERIPDKNKDVFAVPDTLFIFTDTLFAFDHLKSKIQVICNVFLDEFKSAGEAYAWAADRINAEIRRLRSAGEPARQAPVSAGKKPAVRSNFTPAGFSAVVRRAQRYIRRGDIIQVVLSQAFQTKLSAGPFHVYRALRSINPSPYLFYLNCGDFHLAGSSPEIHVRCEGRRAVLRPIAGTRRRGGDAREDAAMEKELMADPKERAEHLMLVDLGRNDLGRVCETGSVKVPEFMTIERYSHVMHIVSRVEGTLRKEKTLFDLLEATFPAGTVSGAPKVRAMEIIDELENRKRGFYSGIVGYFSYSGNLDSCIAIRTILMKGGIATVQAGAGIVADSIPKREYQETVNKARALIRAIQS